MIEEKNNNKPQNPAFLVGAVMLSLRLFSSKLQSEQSFLFFFLRVGKIVNNFFICLLCISYT